MPRTQQQRTAPLPPHDIFAEQAILGSLLLEGASGATIPPGISAILTAASFYREQHGLIYEAMLAVSQRGVPPDLVIISNELETMGRLEEAGNTSYLMHLITIPQSFLNGQRYAEIVAQKAEARRILQEAGRMANEALTGRARAKPRRKVVNFREVDNGE